MNNGYMGMVRQWQELFWDGRYSSVEMGAEPRLGEARRGLRLRPGCAARTSAELEEHDGARRSRPTARCCSTSASRQEENCYPMIPAGAAARDMVG